MADDVTSENQFKYDCLNIEGPVKIDFSGAANCLSDPDARLVGCKKDDGSLAYVQNSGEISRLIIQNEDHKVFAGEVGAEDQDRHLQDLKSFCEDGDATHMGDPIVSSQFTKPFRI